MHASQSPAVDTAAAAPDPGPPPGDRLTWHPGADPGSTILCLDGTLIGGVAETSKHGRALGWGWFLRGGGRHMVGTEQRPTRREAMADLWACAGGYLGLGPAPAPAPATGWPPGDLAPGLAALCRPAGPAPAPDPGAPTIF